MWKRLRCLIGRFENGLQGFRLPIKRVIVIRQPETRMEWRRLVAKWLGANTSSTITQSVFRLPMPYHLGSLKNDLQDFRLPIQHTI
ncbi:hypothetical protein [Kingella oralis]|uniref:hypothetical protein n=1 Tax=Kingella oralis TaxID=505 RepID=UPI0034E47A31